ncbi:MAG: type II secretion system minor pseudopilin GspI [Proteobacteria bacterium]|nr:type II secretion system minor pseudopilin GspI [Pseudomonadota bacterium]
MKSQRAFTLVEVLVALIIVALGMGAALKALTSAADNTSRLREKTFAAWVALNQLATERLGTGLNTSAGKEGEVDFADSRWHWQQTIEDMQVPGLKRITVRVRHSDQPDKPGGPKRSVAPDDWLATVVGFRGDSLQFPQSELAGWDDAGGGQQQPTPVPGQNSTPSTTPPPFQPPGT